jgi:alpha-L-rhamnosidase
LRKKRDYETNENRRNKRNSFGISFVSSILVCFVVSLLSFTQTINQQRLDWPAITSQNKPWTRWWWQGNIVNKKDLTAEMEKYQQAGLGGLEITPIYGIKGYEDRFIEYLSPQWVQMLLHTLKEAERIGLGIDMATGTGWPFGGPWVGDKDACKHFSYKSWTLAGGEQLGETISDLEKPVVRAVGRRIDISQLKDPISANANLQALAIDQLRFSKPLQLITLMAYSDKGNTLDLTSSVGEGGKLNWIAPPGNWTLYAVFQGMHGKMVERAGPGGEGNVIDHFSSLALKNYLSKFDQAFAGQSIKSLRAFFNDSYEVDDADGEADWTPNFFAEFQRRRGYDLRSHLPALFGKEGVEKNSRIRCDFRETISDLLLDQFTIPWRQWAVSKGAITRNQAHGSPANILDLYAASDIPETEGQEIMRMKFASSAANIAGKQLASAETATWLNEHTLATLGEVKQAIDRLFLGGVNHICYHGTPFSPASEEWPGRLFYAAVHFGPSNPFWNDFSALNRYVTRCQSFLQAGKPANDLLLYYPIYDSWSQPGRSLLQHFGGGIESALGQTGAQELYNAGYTYDLISDRQLRNVAISEGAIQTGGASYRAVVLPETHLIPLETLGTLVELARKGATILIHKRLPTDVPGFGNLEQRRNDLKKLLAQFRITKIDDDSVRSAQIGSGRFLVGNDLKRLLEYAGIEREVMVDRGLQFVRRKDARSHLYFIVNQGNQAVDGWVPLQRGARSVALFDPMGEVKGMAASRKSGEKTIEAYLQLAPGQSCILKTFETGFNGPQFDYLSVSGSAQPLTGTWTVQFISGGPELPGRVEVSDLKSWTEFGGEEVKKFSGTASYTITFPNPRGQAESWLLDLGRVAESARVTINGNPLGVLINAPFKVRIPKEMLREQNRLEILITNLMTNRIIDMDRRNVNWKKFYNINMPARRRENAGRDGLFNSAGWTPRESGLIGPVTITATSNLALPAQ